MTKKIKEAKLYVIKKGSYVSVEGIHVEHCYTFEAEYDTIFKGQCVYTLYDNLTPHRARYTVEFVLTENRSMKHHPFYKININVDDVIGYEVYTRLQNLDIILNNPE